MTFDPKAVEVTCVTLPKDHCVQVPWKYITVCGYSDPFAKTWTKGHWPLDDLWPHICWGHMCDSTQGSLCPSPMGINQCMWIQWSILQITTYYILHTYIRYILHTEWVITSSLSEHSSGETKIGKIPFFFLTIPPVRINFDSFKLIRNIGKSKLQVPDTGMSQYWSILEYFLCTSIARKCDPYVL